jgi:hypothetical protein
VPTRATVKQVEIDWAGTLPDAYGMIRPVFDPATASELGREITLEPREAKGNERRFAVNGKLVHQLPGPLEDVRIILVHQPKGLGRIADDPICDTYTGTMTIWQPGDELDLNKEIESTLGINTGIDPLLERVASNQGPLNQFSTTPTFGSTALLGSEMIGTSLFQAFPPPDYDSPNARRPQVVLRESGYGLDLSRWMSQPCIIVIGLLKDVPCPVPVTIDGRDEAAKINKGAVVVRWVYPLPATPVQTPLVDGGADTPVPGGAGGQ